FSPQEVAEYLALHKAPLSAERLYQATQGNALFLVEAVRTLLEQEAHPEDTQHAMSPDDHAMSSILSRMGLTQSQQIRDVVLARVERLPQHAIDLLKIASVIGHPFSLDLLLAELSSDDYHALDILLARRFLLEVSPTKDYEVSLAFSHEMV